MSACDPPTRAELSALIDGTLGEGERVRLEGLLEDNPQWLGEIDRIVGFNDFRDAYLTEAPTEIEVQPDHLVGLIGKLKAGDFSAMAPERIPAFLDGALGEDGEPGRIGEYEVHELIAQGGMGMVFRGRDPHLQRDVAIKVLSPSLAAIPAARDLFLDEARAAAALDHPNVLPIYAVHPGSELPYFVMPFIEGPTLGEEVSEGGALAPKRAVAIAEKVARALAAAHDKGVVHRDIKPANILLEDGGSRVLVADFGIASVGGGRRRVVAGTPEFMAPEQARGEEVTPAADLFALGKVIDFVTAESRPQWLRRLIASLTAEDAARRPAGAAEVAALLKRRMQLRTVPLAIAAAVVAIAAVAVLASRPSARNSPLPPISIEGEKGGFQDLQVALESAGPGAVVLLRGDGRHVLSGLELDAALTIRAEPGSDPVLVQQDESAPMISTVAPLHLEGLALHRDLVSARPEPFVRIEGAPLTLRRCAVFAGQSGGVMFARRAMLELAGGASLDAEDTMMASGLSNVVNFVVATDGSEEGTMSVRMRQCVIGGGFATCSYGGAERIEFDLENVTVGSRSLWIANPFYKLPEIEFKTRRCVLLMNSALIWLPRCSDHWNSGRVRWTGEENVFSSGGTYLRFTFSRAIGGAPESPASVAAWAGLDPVEERAGVAIPHKPIGLQLGDLDSMRRAGRDWLELSVIPRTAEWPERGVDIGRLNF